MWRGGRNARSVESEYPEGVRRIRQTLFRLLRGTSDANIEFNDLRMLLGALGFEERIRGSHHIFTREDVEEIVK